ncbi:enoyl-CoA hydratase/isomerase family protein [Streptomyces misionensis]|uniref:enoyl-CoA hydratase/isomerase family protein n=1 Tax=Streptomyces misionensis TaxID=67331 RepID=UPI0034418728
MLNDFKTLHVEQRDEDRVLSIQLNVPEAGNALSARVVDELHTVLLAAEDDPQIRVLILSGAGDNFCLGGDRGEFSSLIAADPSGASLKSLVNKANRMCHALRSTEKVTIARLHGGVIGAGLGLAVLCHLRVGASDSHYRMPELGVGVPPAWGGLLPRLQHEVGAARFRHLLLTAKKFDAALAAELSILQEVVPASDLDEAVTGLVKPLLRRDAESLRTTVQMLRSYESATHFADVSLLDPEVLTAAVLRRELRRQSFAVS